MREYFATFITFVILSDNFTCGHFVGKVCELSEHCGTNEECVIEDSCRKGVCRCRPCFTVSNSTTQISGVIAKNCSLHQFDKLCLNSPCNGSLEIYPTHSVCDVNSQVVRCEECYQALNNICRYVSEKNLPEGSNCSSNCDCEESLNCRQICDCPGGFTAKDSAGCQPNELGDKCFENEDCKNVQNSRCYNQKCTCQLGFIGFTIGTKYGAKTVCTSMANYVKVGRIGDPCNYDPFDEKNQLYYSVHDYSYFRYAAPVFMCSAGTSCISCLYPAGFRRDSCRKMSPKIPKDSSPQNCSQVLTNFDNYKRRRGGLSRIGAPCRQRSECGPYEICDLTYTREMSPPCDYGLCSCAPCFGHDKMANRCKAIKKLNLGSPCEGSSLETYPPNAECLQSVVSCKKGFQFNSARNECHETTIRHYGDSCLRTDECYGNLECSTTKICTKIHGNCPRCPEDSSASLCKGNEDYFSTKTCPQAVDRC